MKERRELVCDALFNALSEEGFNVYMEAQNIILEQINYLDDYTCIDSRIDFDFNDPDKDVVELIDEFANKIEYEATHYLPDVEYDQTIAWARIDDRPINEQIIRQACDEKSETLFDWSDLAFEFADEAKRELAAA